MSANIVEKDDKRRSITKEFAYGVLKDCIGGMFTAYFKAIDKFNVEIDQTIPEARVRLYSTLLNAKLVESFILTFPDNWTNGKYGRVIFRWDDVQIIIKKLNAKGKPSYIPTLLSDKILSQYQSDLFEGDDSAKAEPVLIFGYTKDKMGQLVDPRIVYFDNDVKWELTKDDVLRKPVTHEIVEDIEVLIKKRGESKSE